MTCVLERSFLLCLPLDLEKLGTWDPTWLPRHGLFPEGLEPLASILVHGEGYMTDPV